MAYVFTPLFMSSYPHLYFPSVGEVAIITLSVHAQRGYGSWVCLSVCVSVTLHLTS